MTSCNKQKWNEENKATSSGLCYQDSNMIITWGDQLPPTDFQPVCVLTPNTGTLSYLIDLMEQRRLASNHLRGKNLLLPLADNNNGDDDGSPGANVNGNKPLPPPGANGNPPADNNKNGDNDGSPGAKNVNGSKQPLPLQMLWALATMLTLMNG